MRRETPFRSRSGRYSLVRRLTWVLLYSVRSLVLEIGARVADAACLRSPPGMGDDPKREPIEITDCFLFVTQVHPAKPAYSN